jgi:hypothetical protein
MGGLHLKRTNGMEDDTLADGTPFPRWRDATIYGRVYHVDQSSPLSSDDQLGSRERPFLTINAAAAQVQPGEKVVVHAGLYREWVRPRRGGESEARMIAFEAAPGEEVIVTGAEAWVPDARPSEGWNLRVEGEARPRIWMANLSPLLFVGYNPFQIRNSYQFLFRYGNTSSPSWMKRVLLFRGMVFIDGAPLPQVLQYQDLGRAEQGFWVEPSGLRLHFRLAGDSHPSGHQFEITAREQAFAPEEYGLGFLRVSGFTFRHTADGLPVPQRGCVSTMRGHHWIVEGNTIEWTNGVALDIGCQSWEALPGPETGRHIVRGNEIRHVGVCGIAGALGVWDTVIEENLIERIGFHNVERIFECAAIKFHFARNTLIRGNFIRHINHACGLWLDVDHVNCRVTGNIFAGIRSRMGGVYSELNFAANQVDRNLFWDIAPPPAAEGEEPSDPAAVRADCNEKLEVNNNFFGQIGGPAVNFSLMQHQRRVKGRTGLCRHNRAVGNIFFRCRTPVALGRLEMNASDGNLFDNESAAGSFSVAYPEPGTIQNLAGWREYFTQDGLSAQVGMDAAFDVASGELRIRITGLEEEVRWLGSSGPNAGAVGPFDRDGWRMLQNNQLVVLRLWGTPVGSNVTGLRKKGSSAG